MSRLTSRPAVVLAGVLAVGLTAGPALATTSTPTSLTLKAAKSTVAANTKDTLTGTLKSGATAQAGEVVRLIQRSAGATKYTRTNSYQRTDKNGQVTLTVTPGTKKGQKEQYVLIFDGNASKHLKASHSAVITVTVS
jgi:hypothetical protein